MGNPGANRNERIGQILTVRFQVIRTRFWRATSHRCVVAPYWRGKCGIERKAGAWRPNIHARDGNQHSVPRCRNLQRNPADPRLFATIIRQVETDDASDGRTLLRPDRSALADVPVNQISYSPVQSIPVRSRPASRCV